MSEVSLHVYRDAGTGALLARLPAGRSGKIHTPSKATLTQRLAAQLCPVIALAREQLRNHYSDAMVAAVAAMGACSTQSFLPPLASPDPIRIPFTTLYGKPPLPTSTVLTIPRGFVSVGPGSPVLMYAENITVRLPQPVVSMISAGNGTYMQNLGHSPGHFSADRLITSPQTWRDAFAHGQVHPHKIGTTSIVETPDRRQLCCLDRFMWTIVGTIRHVNTDPGVACIVTTAQAAFF